MRASISKVGLQFAAAIVLASSFLPVVAFINPQQVSAESSKVLPSADGNVMFGFKKHDGYAAGADAFLQLRQAQIGRNYNYERIFFSVGEWENKSLLTNQRLSAAINEGRIPMVSFSVSKNNWAAYASGTNDATINALADKVKALNTPMWVTFTHEPDNKACLNTSTTCTTGPKTEVYVNMWRHFHDLFDAKGVNVSWNWIVMTYSFGPFASAERKQIIKDLYPGDSYVDWISADPYNFIQTNNTGVCPFWRNDATQQTKWDSSWKSLGKEMQEWYDWSSQRGKPLALAEFGVLNDPRVGKENRKADWLRQAANDLKTKYTNIKAVSYFDNIVTSQSDNCDWRIDPSTSVNASSPALTAYKEIAQDPYFNPGVAQEPDVDNPAVSILSPAPDSQVQGTVIINAGATDNRSVGRIELYLDGNLVSTCASASCSFSWNTTLATNGSIHDVRAVAYDTSNNSSETIISNITVNNPVVTGPVLTPTNITSGQTLKGTVTLSATATYTTGINRVSFFYVRSNGQEVWIATDSSSPYSTSFNTAALANGSYKIRYKAFDRSSTMSTIVDVPVQIAN